MMLGDDDDNSSNNHGGGTIQQETDDGNHHHLLEHVTSSLSSSSTTSKLKYKYKYKSSKKYQPIAMELEDSAIMIDDEDGVVLPHHQHATTSSSCSTSVLLCAFGCFWMLGLLNNTSYVLMIACAKSISEGGTALVFLANIVPSLAVNGSAPYWFDHVSYRTRIQLAAACMAVSLGLVAMTTTTSTTTTSSSSSSGDDDNTAEEDDESSSTSTSSSTITLTIQLLGVAFSSFQCGLGEASLLALAGKVDGAINTANANANANAATSAETKRKGQCLTSFSSGTGMAGVFGFFWVWLWNDTIGYSLSTTLWLALISLPLGYWCSFQYAQKIQMQMQRLQQQQQQQQQQQHHHHMLFLEEQEVQNMNEEEDEAMMLEKLPDDEQEAEEPPPPAHERQALAPSSPIIANERSDGAADHDHDHGEDLNTIPISEMTSTQRFQLVLRLWPYMIPLFVVYASEYALQSGTWTAIGFPLDDVEARNEFFEYSNWMYQAGVFLSRSSGTLFTAPMVVLWIMPALQFLNLGIYTYIAASQSDITTTTSTSTTTTSSSFLLHRPSVLYAGALYTGLLGGAVYIHGYKRICLDIPNNNIPHREFSLAATSLAEGVGIVVADILGLVLQSCLYQVNHLEGAFVSCPISNATTTTTTTPTRHG